MNYNETIFIFFIFVVGVNHALKAQEKTAFVEDLTSFMKPYIENRDFDGYILIEKSDSILLSRGFGIDANHLTENSQFMIGSITKTFTAEAISLLVNQGKVSFKDQLKAFAPMLPNASKIQVKNLLTHSSGIVDYYAVNDFNHVRNEETTLEDFTMWISHYAPAFKPGSQNSYSNSGYNLLAYLIECISGLNYRDFLETNIFGPLEMNSTGSFKESDDQLTNLVEGFSPGGLPTLLRKPNELHFSWLIGSGSVFSSAKDLLKWCSFIESRVGREPDWTPYGWGERSRGSLRYLKQNGRIPGYSSVIQIFPALELNVIVLNRIESDAVNSISDGIINILLREKVDIPEIRKVKELSASKLSEYTGTYQFAPNFFVTFQVKNGSLMVATGKGDNLDFSVMDYLGNDEFFFRVTNNYISFTRDQNDKISGMRWAGSEPFPKINE